MVLLAAAFLITVYYKKSSIKLENNRVIINVKDKSVFLDYNLKKSENVTFSNLNIVQKELDLNGQTAFLEIATADALYQFSGKTEFIVKTVFEAKKINKIFSINGLKAIEVVLKNDKVLNLFVDDNDMKTLTFFYGLPTDIFLKTVERLQGRESKLLYQKNIEPLAHAESHWSVVHNDIDGVMESIDY
jgi:archaellin